MTPKKNSHCSCCGQRFPEAAPWPRTCAGCAQTSYLNPIPVAVLLLPVGDGLLHIRRGIEPGRGKLALPGGFIDLGESWQQACARELFEETGIRVPPDEVKAFRVLSAPDGTVLIFGLGERRASADLPPFQPTNETTERVVLARPEPLAFPLHTRVAQEYFAGTGSAAPR